MKTDYLELHADYLISNGGAVTATGLSAMMENEIEVLKWFENYKKK